MPVSINLPPPRPERPTFGESFREAAGQQIIPAATGALQNVFNTLVQAQQADKDRAFKDEQGFKDYERKLEMSTVDASNQARLGKSLASSQALANLPGEMERGRQQGLNAQSQYEAMLALQRAKSGGGNPWFKRAMQLQKAAQEEQDPVRKGQLVQASEWALGKAGVGRQAAPDAPPVKTGKSYEADIATGKSAAELAKAEKEQAWKTSENKKAQDAAQKRTDTAVKGGLDRATLAAKVGALKAKIASRQKLTFDKKGQKEDLKDLDDLMKALDEAETALGAAPTGYYD